jgi:peptide/nickel transport system substrate-binding protein
MKKFCILLACLFLILGCSRVTEKEGPLSKKDKYGGTLYRSTISDPKSFNLIIAKETSTTDAVGLLFEGLTKTNGVTTEVEPCLAENWEYSKDGLVWTFYLRKDVKWFDGVPFTADDVVFTYNELIYNEDIPASARDIFTIEGKPIKVEKIDTYTVRFTLPKPFAPLLRNLGESILPKHKLQKVVKEGKFNSTWGVDTPPEELVGTGPFMMKYYRPGERIVYVRNPNYWQRDKEGNRLPYLERVVTLIVENQDAQLVRFEAGEIDVLSIREKDYSYLKLKEKEGNFTVYNCGPSFGTNFLAFNLNPNYTLPSKFRIFKDLAFRRAVAHSIDKKSIINNVMNGLGYPQHSAMEAAAKFFHNPNVKKYEYNLESARRILEEAGYKDRDGDGIREDKFGNELRFCLITNVENNMRKDIGVIIKQDLEKIGLKVDFTPIDFNTLVTKLDASYDWDAVLVGLTGGVEPHSGKNVWAVDGHLHFWNPKPKGQDKKKLKIWEENLEDWEKEIDKIFNRGATILDPKKRKKLYDRWQEIVAEKLPLIYTVNGAALYAVRNKFGDLKPTAYGGVLHNIERIYVKR